MRKIILQEWVSLDGFAAGPNDEIDFFIAPELAVDSDDDLLQFMDSIDTILLGGVTYQLFAEYWPTEQSTDEIIADRLNATPKYIFSKSLKATPWGKWDNANQVKEDAVEYVRRLKQQEGKDMVLWGSLSLAQSFFRAGLIDEVELRICPVAIGKGRTIFPDNMDYINLELLDSKQYRSGLMMIKYRVK